MGQPAEENVTIALEGSDAYEFSDSTVYTASIGDKFGPQIIDITYGSKKVPVSSSPFEVVGLGMLLLLQSVVTFYSYVYLYRVTFLFFVQHMGTIQCSYIQQPTIQFQRFWRVQFHRH